VCVNFWPTMMGRPMRLTSWGKVRGGGEREGWGAGVNLCWFDLAKTTRMETICIFIARLLATHKHQHDTGTGEW
jgi:hypothetical protein